TTEALKHGVGSVAHQAGVGGGKRCRNIVASCGRRPPGPARRSPSAAVADATARRSPMFRCTESLTCPDGSDSTRGWYRDHHFIPASPRRVGTIYPVDGPPSPGGSLVPLRPSQAI